VLIGGVLVIATVSAWWLTVPASLGLGTITFLVVNGVVQNSRGELSWNGGADLVLLLACLLLPAASAELGFEVIRERKSWRESAAAGRKPGLVRRRHSGQLERVPRVRASRNPYSVKRST